ncbi:MAG: EAL domain-containing protein [Proteobacteria bacterium]|nr:EAL domain-containing protein [Pseudomonadota bacterium]
MKQRLLLGLLLVTALTCGALLLGAYSEVKREAIEALDVQQETLAKQAAQGIQDFFSHHKKTMETLVHNPHIIALDPEGEAMMRVFLAENFGEVLALTRVDAQGRIVFSTPDASVIGRNVSDQAHVRRIMNEHRPVVSDVFKSVQGYPAIALHVPVFQGDDYKGSLAMLIAFDVISKRYLEGIRVAENGYAFVLSEKGVILYTPVNDLVGQNIREATAEFPSLAALSVRMLRGESGTGAFTFDHIRNIQVERLHKLAAFQPIKIENTFWSICVATPEAEVLASLKRFRDYLLPLSAAILAIAAFSLYLVFRHYLLQREIAKRRESEVALRESENKYRSVIENITDVFYRSDANGLLDMISPSGVRLLGYASMEEMLGQPIEDAWMHPKERKVLLLMLQKHGEVRDYELVLKRKDGSPVHVSTSSRLNLDLDGNVLGIEGTFRDITERKNAEEALQASQRRFSELIRYSSDSITILDRNGIQRFVSDAVERMLGYEPAELIGTPVIKEMLHPDDQEKVAAAFATILNEGTGGTQYRHRHKNGSWVYLEAWGTNQLNNPDIRGIIVNVRDITERKQAEAALKQSEAKFRAIFNNTPVGIFRSSFSGGVIDANPTLARMHGYASAEEFITGVHDLGLDVYEHREDRQRLLDALLAHPAGTRMDVSFLRKDGSVFQSIVNAALHFDLNGVPAYIDGTIEDITERRRAELALEESVRQFNSLFDNMTEGVALHSLVYDAAGVLMDYTFQNVNTSFERILGFKAEMVRGRLASEVYGTGAAPFLEEFAAVALTGTPSHVEHYFPPMGKHFSISIAPWGDGGFSTIFADITGHKQLEEQLLFRALHDPLTGLANRTLCLDRIAQANERSARKPESSFSVVFIDLDRFKVINDSLGHEAGDLLLREVAQRLLSCARRVDTVCRYGGDEFTLVMEELTARETVRTVKRVRESLKTPMTIGTHEIQVEASYGIAYAPQDNCTAEDLLRNANIALHRAKLSGRDRIVAYRKGMHEAAIQTMSLQSDMLRGLEAGEFFMVYQSIFNLDSGRLAGFEALIRWRHPQRGIVNPVEFIPLAEESGFIFELGNFALTQACKDMVELLLDLPTNDHLTVSVNLSPRQFSRQGLADQIEQTLLSSGLPPSSLVIEITESSIMKHPEASAHILHRLKEKGVGIAIDDFGTGYSSMSALQKLPLDRLKVDMSFVSRMTDSSEDREIVRAIITLARSLRLRTVAEGIETEAQRILLRDMHCDLGQGYLCSRPMLLKDVPQAIRLKACMEPL